MYRLLVVLLLGLVSLASHASGADKGQGIIVYGKADQEIPGWAISTSLPDGWTQDCCMYAKAIGVNLVLYRGEWTGKPERVMVFNVWTRKLATLADEVAADRKQYLGRDAAAKVTDIAIHNLHMPCQGTLYQGSDRIDDMVVYCDPGKASGIRISWSMSFADADATRRPLLDAFMQVATEASYMHYVASSATKKP